MPRKKSKSIARKAYNLAKRNAQLFKPELKYHPYSTSANGVDSTGTIVGILSISQGNSDTTRVGDQLRVIGIHMNYFVEDVTTLDYTSAAFDNHVSHFRVILYRDKSDTINTVGNYLQNSGTLTSFLSSKDHDKRHEAVKIYDKIHSLNVFSPQKHMRKFIRLGKNGILVSYQGGGTTINTNNIKLLLITDRTTATNLNFHPNMKIFYLDS